MNVAARPELTSISLCAGVGMLDEAVRAALEYFGFRYRCLAYVERDAYAAAVLVARMEGKALDQAPIWDDLTTFDGAAWRGLVDIVAAGFPCQDLSVAGRRAGLDGKRSGLFFRVLDIADDCDAQGLVLENVGGVATSSAAFVDEAGIKWDERAASRVVGELADRGWHAEWLHLSASAVGASHGRERWFCFAWRVADSARLPGRQWAGRERILHKDSQVEDAHVGGRRAQGDCGIENRAAAAGGQLVHPESFRCREGRPEHDGLEGRYSAAVASGQLGYPNGTNCEGGGAAQ